jgi:hypothetical protein
VLSRLFSELNLAKAYKKHLDLFQGVNAKDSSKLALHAFGIEPPENILIDFDFENRVVIMKNKKTKQMIIMFGSEHNCEHSIGFGKQLMDTFKPKTVFLEDSPLEERVSGDEKGLKEEGVTKVVDRLAGEELKEFIMGSIVMNKEAYEVDIKHNMVYQNYYQGV